MVVDSPLITAEALWAALQAGASIVIFDCSFDLAEKAAGLRAHEAARVPGAMHVDLDRDLSVAPSGSNGRHPLPDRAAFAARLAALGARDDALLVAYDASGGIYAARLWWMLRWAGHEQAAVLDGGLAAWRAAGAALASGPAATPTPGSFTLRRALVETLDYATLRAQLGAGRRLVVDARAPDRFRGENETLDPVGGHIPGAVNRSFRDNLAADGRFLPAAQLRDQWDAVRAGRDADDLVQQCGSGVTACHNLLALEVVALSGSRLYPGSWSEWCAQPDAPIAIG